MRKVNINQIKEDPWQSPGGKYAASFKGISEALGREPASLDLSKRHPFDLEWTRVPPGKSNFPYHAHSAQWELYLVISGKGIVRHKDGKIGESGYYPDSGKWKVNKSSAADRVVIKGDETDYFDGEE
jgi:hypothetical protein